MPPPGAVPDTSPRIPPGARSLVVAPPRLPAALGRRHHQPGRHPAVAAGPAGAGRHRAARGAARDGRAHRVRDARLPPRRAAGRRLGRPVAQEARARSTGDVVRALAFASLPLAWALGHLPSASCTSSRSSRASRPSSSTSPTRATCPPSSTATRWSTATRSCRPASPSPRSPVRPLGGALLRIVARARAGGRGRRQLRALRLLRAADPARRDAAAPGRARRPLRTEIAEGLSLRRPAPPARAITACTSIGNFAARRRARAVRAVRPGDARPDAPRRSASSSPSPRSGGSSGPSSRPGSSAWSGEGRTIPLSASCSASGSSRRRSPPPSPAPGRRAAADRGRRSRRARGSSSTTSRR